MKCSRCKSVHNVKDGHIHGLQRYKCKDCGRSFTVSLKSTAKSEEVKRQALQMYLEGLGFSSIARILRVSHVSVLNWIRKYGREIDSIRNEKPVKVMELDELHTYVGHKKTTSGFGLALVETTESTLISWSATEAQKRD